MTYRLGFAMAQVAGHATHSRNLRRVADADDSIEATWSEIAYHRPGGWVERVAGRLGKGQALRPVVDMFNGLGSASFDAILVNTPLVGLYPQRILDAPMMVDFDSTPALLAQMEEYDRPERNGLAARAKGAVEDRFWERATLLQSWSEWAKASAVDDYGFSADRIIVNPPGVDLDLWRPRSHSDVVGRSQRILFVGGDFQRKGGEDLLEWFRRSRPGNAELHIITREHVASVDGVTVHHDLEPNSGALVELYQASDLFVLPTRAECFGIATVEAMACGLPVVVGDVGASSEIVEHGANGFLVPPKDTDALGDAITRILDEDAARQRMAARSRKIAETKFDLRRNATRTMTTLKALADGRTPA